IVGTVFILSGSKYYTNEGQIFGTTYHITYAGTNDLDKEIRAELQRVDDALSMFNKQSVLSKFNRNEKYDVSNARFNDVVRLSLQLSRETDGAFDITVAPLVNEWGFGFKHRERINASKIDSLRAFVGYDKLFYDGDRLNKRDSRVTIDCGAVAKGYGVDCVARLLSSKGCTNYMVEIGGEVVVKGKNAKGKKWTIGINKPVDDSTKTVSEVQSILHVSDCGIATSGNYRNFYYVDGRKVSHTIDPKTGQPVQHSLLSATVLTPSCAKSDALATSFMVMGLDRAKAFLAKHKDVQAYFIFADGQGKYNVWMTEGMQKLTEP
ncbi:MAG: FAD:protein FMN transferase, partial [Prevotellaceae bacterium]|nr:FAD:protein FMN transferase [Prevotellaceae bacterium]